jgi:hypothetical protein
MTYFRKEVDYQRVIDPCEKNENKFEPLMTFKDEEECRHFFSENEEDGVTSSNRTEQTNKSNKRLTEDCATANDKQVSFSIDNKASEHGHLSDKFESKLVAASESYQRSETNPNRLVTVRPEAARFPYSSSPNSQHLGAIPKRRLVQECQRPQQRESNQRISDTNDLLLRRRRERENQWTYEMYESDDDDSVREQTHFL